MNYIFKKYHDLLVEETEKFIETNIECCLNDYKKHKMAKEMLASIYYLQNINVEETASRMADSFNYDMAKHWVESMNPKAKWTIEETTAVAKQYGVEFEHITEYCWWVAMNKMYSDHYKMVDKYAMGDVAAYVELAKEWLFDEDSAVSPREKMSITYKYLMKK